jgi:uncharacterized phage-like protein YoqJ
LHLYFYFQNSNIENKNKDLIQENIKLLDRIKELEERNSYIQNKKSYLVEKTNFLRSFYFINAFRCLKFFMNSIIFNSDIILLLPSL